MSVKGFNIYEQIQKYDYNALENRPVSAELDNQGIASFKNENGVAVFTLDLSELEGGGGGGSVDGVGLATLNQIYAIFE